ncbi:MAG: putative flippase GtrA [Algoriphagus sp.]|jgi:putative flippase GtrA
MNDRLKRNQKSLIAYFLTAASGVIVQYVVGTIICIRYLDLPFNDGVSYGYLAAIPVGFILSKNYVFNAKKSGKTRKEVGRYIITLIISYFITVKGAQYSLDFLTHTFGDFRTNISFTELHFSPIGSLSHVAGMGFSFIFNYLAHKKFTFVG